MNNSILVKIFDSNKKLLGKGHLNSYQGQKLIIKGNYLPELSKDSIIYVNIFDQIRGITALECKVIIGARMQLTAKILHKISVVERRKSLKISTNLRYPVGLIIRNNKSIESDNPIFIRIKNLSIGGMLIESNFDFEINDNILFTFNFYHESPINLKAEVIRIDKHPNGYSLNYGCIFKNITQGDENVICKYLYERQIQLLKNKS